MPTEAQRILARELLVIDKECAQASAAGHRMIVTRCVGIMARLGVRLAASLLEEA
jgi:hypothetical protein